MSEPGIGSREWWRVHSLFSLRGPVDSILRLLEQREITRGRAREILFYAARVTGGFWMKPAPEETPPEAPWDKLNWCGDAVSDGGDAAKLARIGEAMRKLIAGLHPESIATAYMLPVARRVLDEVES